VIGAELLDDAVRRGRLEPRLCGLLQPGLEVVEPLELDGLDPLGEQALDDLDRRDEPTVEVDRREDRLERVGEDRWLGAAARLLLALAEHHPLADAELAGDLAQAGLAHDLGAGHAELAFPELRIPRHQLVAHDQVEDRVAQELEPLIVEMLPLFFVGNARVSEGLSQETGITKLIPDALFERMHVSLGRAVRLFFVNSDRSHHINRPLQSGVVQSRSVPAPGAPLLARLNLGIGAGEQGGFIEVRPVGFKNESRHAFR
jgi:hypothetical protein